MRFARIVMLGFAMCGVGLATIAQPNDQLIIVGAGNSGSWHTEFEFANPLDLPVHAGVGILAKAADPCVTGFCPVKGFDMAAGGSRRENSSGPPVVWDGVGTYFVASEEGLPTVRAWLVNELQPTQTIELPVVRRTTIARLQPTLLAFPSAERTALSHSNLIIAEVGNSGDLSIVVEALSADGQLLGSQDFVVPALGTLFVVDVLRAVNVNELTNGQVRVRQVGGAGLMWGLLPTLSDNGRISVSQGASP